MMMEDDQTLGNGSTVQCIDHVFWKCTLETCIILTNVTSTNLILKYVG